MEIALLNKLSDLTFYGFFDPSKGMVTVHFFNEANNKPDVIAYLREDMSWDVREIVDEQSELHSDKEVVTILHEPLGIEEHGSQFDEFVRLGVTKLGEEIHGADVNLPETDIVFRVFENNSYNK